MPEHHANGGRLDTFRAAGWRGRVAARWRHLVSVDPLAWLAQQPQEIVRQRPSATTYRVGTEGGSVYVKHMTALKDREPGSADRISALRWRLGPSLALRVLRVHGQLVRCGLRVAPVLLAARRRSGGQAEDLLVTGEVTGPNLQQVFDDASDDETRCALIRMAGQRVAGLHRLRFTHGDLLPGNLVVTPDRADVVWLDNDRSRRWFPVIPASARRRNLAQIAFRLIYWYRYRWTRLFLDSYYDACGWAAAARRRESAVLLRKARARTLQARFGPGRQLPRRC